jgi:biotin carboxylase
MKTILILGIGNAQVDAIKICKELGYIVHTCSNTEKGRGRDLGDKFALINITDKEAIKKYVELNNIDLLYSVGSDVAMPTVSYVSEKLSLPCFNSYDTASICNFKNKCRELIGNNEDYNVKFQILDKFTDKLEIDYPFIMKPVDSQGQRGVFLINNKDEFYQNFNVSLSYSTIKKLIIEEYVDGEEISVNAYLINGEIVFSQTSDRVSWPQYQGGIIHKHIIPSRNQKDLIERRIQSMVRSVTNKLKIKNGPAYFQIKVKEEQPKLIEATPRLDGCHMWRLIKYYTSINLLEITFKHLFGGIIDPKSFNKKKRKEIYELEFICLKPNFMVKESHFKIKDCLYMEEYYTQGESVRRLNGFFEKIGYCIREIN